MNLTDLFTKLCAHASLPIAALFTASKKACLNVLSLTRRKRHRYCTTAARECVRRNKFYIYVNVSVMPDEDLEHINCQANLFFS